MMRFSRLLLFGIACAMMIPVLTPNAALAWPHDLYSPTAVAPGTLAEQDLSTMLPDGAGGAFYAWTDKRGGTEDVYVQRLSASGAVVVGWPASGLEVCTTVSRKLEPQLVADGAGGVIVVWTDYRSGPALGNMYAARLNGDGTRAAGFPAAGVPLGTLPFNQQRPRACTDGAGGALVSWESLFAPTDTDIIGAHITSAGAVAFSGYLDGSLHDSRQVSVAPDGAGGYFTAYQDSSAGVGIRVYAVHVSGSGFALAGPARISNSVYTSNKKAPHILADGSGGFFAAWLDNELSATYDVVFMRYSSSLGPQFPWYDGGVGMVNPVASFIPDLSMVTDGAGGFFAAWSTTTGDVILGHSTAAGNSASAVTEQDMGPGFFAYNPQPAQMVSDGSGGVILFGYTSSLAPRALRITSGGALAARWTWLGTPVSGYGAGLFTGVTDGNHGAIMGWSDPHPSGSFSSVYAQRIDRFAAIGDAGPVLTTVKDVPLDQGEKVILVWTPSYLDSDPTYEIGSYWIWRQVPGAVAANAVRAGARWATATSGLTPADAVHGRLFQPSSSQAYAWEFVATQSANGSAQYSFVAPTTVDSTAAGNPFTTFMVEAHSSTSIGFWDSAPDSGYSVDNLAPGTPVPFVGQYSAGATAMHWGANKEPDLAGYRLYRGASPAFVPGPGSLVAALPDTSLTDAAGHPYIYKLTAVDIHGNESVPALLVPAGTTGVGMGGAPAELSFAPPSPNPAAGLSVMRYALPARAPVRLAIYDPSGRLVRELARGGRDAGTYAEVWDLRDGAGRSVGAGLYFARLEVGGRTLVQRVAVTR